MLGLERLVPGIIYLGTNILKREDLSPLVEIIKQDGKKDIAQLTAKGIRRMGFDLRTSYHTLKEFDERFKMFEGEYLSQDHSFTNFKNRYRLAIETKLTSDIASQFDDRFDAKNILWLHEDMGISPEYANSFDSRFNSYDVEDFIRSGFDPEIVNSVNERFVKSGEVMTLLLDEINLDVAIKFDERFDGTEITGLIRDDFSSEEANAYKAGNGETIRNFKKQGITAKVANEFDERFFVDKNYRGANTSILYLIECGKDASTANDYDPRFGVDNIIEFDDIGLTSKKANIFDEKYKRSHILGFKNLGMDGEEANLYLLKYKPDEALEIAEGGINSQDAIDYNGGIDSNTPRYYSPVSLLDLKSGNFLVDESLKVREVIGNHYGKQKNVHFTIAALITGDILEWARINETFGKSLNADQIGEFYKIKATPDDIRQTMKNDTIVNMMNNA